MKHKSKSTEQKTFLFLCTNLEDARPGTIWRVVQAPDMQKAKKLVAKYHATLTGNPVVLDSWEFRAAVAHFAQLITDMLKEDADIVAP